MNRFVQLFFIAAALIVVSEAGREAEMMAAAEKCQASTKATPADMEAVQKQSLDLTKEGKCAVSCMMQHFKLLSADGKLQKDVYMKEAEEMAKGDAAMMTHANEIFDKCQGQGDPDICEAAFKYCVCMQEEMNARGIKLEH